MARFKKWQSGSADLVSVAVGMVILSIAAAGTSSAMIYGREVLGRQERYKSAAYILKREMEKKIWELKSFPRAAEAGALSPRSLITTELVDSHERSSGNQPVMVTVYMDRIESVLDPGRLTIAYYTVSMHARWNEPEMAGGRSENNFQFREISYMTAVDSRASQ